MHKKVDDIYLYVHFIAYYRNMTGAEKFFLLNFVQISIFLCDLDKNRLNFVQISLLSVDLDNFLISGS